MTKPKDAEYRIIAGNFGLYPAEWRVLAAVRREQSRPGESMSNSQAIRYIINDWQRLQQAANAAPQAQGEVG